jgi:hemerythrin
MFIPTKAVRSDSSFLTWTSDLAIGHDLIDADHQDIFHIANRLQSEILQKPKPDYSIVGQVLVELIEHTGGHFAREEALMQEIDFPSFEDHKIQHKILMNGVDDLHRQFMKGRSDLSAEVLEFLHLALVPHVLKWDMDLGRCLRSAGK